MPEQHRVGDLGGVPSIPAPERLPPGPLSPAGGPRRCRSRTCQAPGVGEGTWFIVVMGVMVGGALLAAAWFDVQARRRGSKLVSGAEMARAIKDAKREARAARGRGWRPVPGGTRRSGRPSWDDREG